MASQRVSEALRHFVTGRHAASRAALPPQASALQQTAATTAAYLKASPSVSIWRTIGGAWRGVEFRLRECVAGAPR